MLKEISIPKEDLANALPIRWAFHCYMSGCYLHRWNFKKWRKYLLGMYSGSEAFNRWYENRPKDCMAHIEDFLKANNIKTGQEFLVFYSNLLIEYKKVLNNDPSWKYRGGLVA